MTEAWYALRTKPHKEGSVWRQVQADGLVGFYPTIRVNPVNPRAQRERPYFPCYLFVHADLEQTGQAVFEYMPHAIGLVRFGGEPGIIPSPVVVRIRQHLVELRRLNLNMESEIRPGEAVSIRDGPLEGYRAILDHHLPGRDRVRVLLQLIGDRKMPVELSHSSIARLEDGSLA